MNDKQKKTSSIVQTRLPPDYSERLDKLCAQYGLNRAMYVRTILIKHLDGMDENLLYKALTELQNEIHKERINQQTMTQLWLYWLGNYFGKHPEIQDEEERKKIALIARKKVEQFLKNFAEHTFEYNGDLYDMLFAEANETDTKGKK